MRFENCWSTVPPQVLIWLLSSLFHRRKLLVIGLGYCKIKIPPLISAVICFLIPLACWLKWLLLEPASHPNLAAIMDNKYCPEKKKQARPGLNVVVSTRCRSNFSSCELSSVKARGESGPQNSIAKNLLLRKPLKLVQSTEALPTLALFLLCIFCPEPFPELPDIFFFPVERPQAEGLLLLYLSGTQEPGILLGNRVQDTGCVLGTRGVLDHMEGVVPPSPGYVVGEKIPQSVPLKLNFSVK